MQRQPDSTIELDAVAVPPGPGGERARRGADQVRRAIVEATVRIIGVGGVAAVTHRAVAREAGVSLSSTTYHFDSKAQIIDAALRAVAAREIERVERATAALSGDVREVEALVDALVGWLEDQLAGDRLVVRAGYELQLEGERSPELDELHRAWGRAVQRLAADVLERAGSPSPRHDAHILAAFIDGVRLEEITRPRPDVATRMRPLFDRFLRALIGG